LFLDFKRPDHNLCLAGLPDGRTNGKLTAKEIVFRDTGQVVSELGKIQATRRRRIPE
jgi:hypothetical protein